MRLTPTVVFCLWPLVAACAAPGGGSAGGGAGTSPEALAREIEALPSPARDHVAAVTRLLASKPSLALDFTAASGETCLNTGGQVMAHYSVRPDDTTEDIVFFVDAGPLVEKGLRLQEFPALEPGLGAMQPGVWYRYEGEGKEPHHGMALPDRRWLMVATDVR